MMISMSWTLSLISIFLNHPMSLGLILLSQTILISLSSGMMNLDYWFSYILFLIMIGGMLVLFIYMTSIAANEKFKFSKKMLMFSILILINFMSLMVDNFFPNIHMNNYDLLNKSLNHINLSMNKFFNMPNMMIMMLLMLYLLVTLIAVVKITFFKMGPLRSTK
uniref:NADH-ubiquinone oxidoreductase chain 6 n=1 Tax=Curculionidae sp. BMNH 1042554 TaxID=2834647 RepID=A0A8F4WEH6_9CUCU|nr:NADH dehydrogenase subunit 6 [Curculionidae sp. BMNH 1042554]